MEFNKKLIYDIIDNKINKIELRFLNKQELKSLYNALKLNSSLKILNLSNNQIEDKKMFYRALPYKTFM